MARRPLSKRTRFEVFKRDGFACQYCGRTPPEVVLECDHIIPVVEGGSDAEGNLLTACFDCNRGKAGVSLSVHPLSLAERAARAGEAEEQIAAYRAAMQAVEDRREADIWRVVEALYSATATTHVRYQSIKMFLRRLDFDEVLEAAEIARSAMPWSDPQRFKYFCGVCWRKVGEAQ